MTFVPAAGALLKTLHGPGGKPKLSRLLRPGAVVPKAAGAPLFPCLRHPPLSPTEEKTVQFIAPACTLAGC
ncbi:MAG: hypothetical protein R2788_12720 [Saprospiraceae bacterium]